MKKVVIVGGGVSGLACGYTFKRRYKNIDVKVLEPNIPGGEFLSGGLKYIHRTNNVVGMLTDLDLVFSNYTIRGGILLRGKVQNFPRCFERMNKQASKRIREDYYRKTRFMEPGKNAKRAMDEPVAIRPRRALRCDFESMVKALKNYSNIVHAGLKKVGSKVLHLTNGKLLPFDYLVFTIPLWVVRDCFDSWYFPHSLAIRRNVITVVPRRDRYVRWDYVYTPYTPENSIYRISSCNVGYEIEVSGNLDVKKLHGDLNFLFRGGWWIDDVKEDLMGYLLPLEEEVFWPEKTAPIGRFSQWDSLVTLDTILDDSIELGDRWFNA